MNSTCTFFAPAPRGMAGLLAEELHGLGAGDLEELPAGVSFSGPLALAYRACLWSRVASRVLMLLARFPAPTPEYLYAGVRAIPWAEHLSPCGTLAVDFHSSHSRITHTHFGSLKVKDAIVDQFRQDFGVRPSVELARPDVRVHVYLHQDQARVSLDLAGDSLHRRGYRSAGGEAPLKENLAAALLLLAGWPELARQGRPLADLMCGSGTLPIEGGLIAADIAPGWGRQYWGFLGWHGHQPGVWEELLAEARTRREQGLARLPLIRGCDADPAAVAAARANLERAGLAGLVEVEERALSAGPPAGLERAGPGLVVVNPPYGERLGQQPELVGLYAELGQVLRRHFAGWQAAVFTGNPELARRLGLRPWQTHDLDNGPIPCQLLRFEIGTGAREPDPGAAMFANRLRKNLRVLGRWARREGVQCFRVYDADLPDYALAVDLYQGEDRWAHVQEYAAPATIDPGRAEARRQAALELIPQVLDLPVSQVHFKLRTRQKGRAQYEKRGDSGRLWEVREGPWVFLANFADYLDTGLFLDQRLTRQLVCQLARGRHFLNLFAYTGTATVAAAWGGARTTVSVDLSRPYLEWARRNLERNGLAGPRHRFVPADCLEWLERGEEDEFRRRRYGLIFLDPPTFSNSKRMGRTFDVQRDHAWLIQQVAQLLAPEGVLLFSCNFRRFKMDPQALAGLTGEDITAATIPKDFARQPRIHQCWKMVRR